MDLLCVGLHYSHDLLYCPKPRHHSARRAFFRILAKSCYPDRAVDRAVLHLRTSLPQETRIIACCYREPPATLHPRQTRACTADTVTHHALASICSRRCTLRLSMRRTR